MIENILRKLGKITWKIITTPKQLISVIAGLIVGWFIALIGWWIWFKYGK